MTKPIGWVCVSEAEYTTVVYQPCRIKGGCAFSIPVYAIIPEGQRPSTNDCQPGDVVNCSPYGYGTFIKRCADGDAYWQIGLIP